MFRSALKIVAITLTCSALIAGGVVATVIFDRGGFAAEPRYDYHEDIEPILIEYCYECHGDGMDKGGVAFDEHEDLQALLGDVGFWEHIYNNVEGNLMPPGEEPQPVDEDRAKIASWIEREVFQLDPKNPDPGRVTIRRLNREEYNNTLRDLVGVDLRPADEFPEDDTGYGYDTIGDVLTLSPALLERYFDAAGRVLDAAMVTEAPEPKVQDFPAKEFRGRRGTGNGNGMMTSDATVGVRLTIRTAGRYKVEALAGGSQARQESPIMKVAVEGAGGKDFHVGRSMDDPGWYPLELELSPGEPWLDASFTNDMYDPKAKDPLQRDRNLKVFRLRVTGPLDLPPPPPSEVQERLLAVSDPEAPEAERAGQVIERFARRAFRRPLSGEEMGDLLALFGRLRSEDRDFEAAVKLTFQAILVSPRFLFRGEVQPDPDNPDAVHPIDEHALASRLSYFLWSSMPDQQLMDLAERGELRDRLGEQVERMLADERATALTRNFAGQWLQLRNLDLASPDPGRFKSWSDQLRASMRAETEHFFAGIVAENRSILEFLDSDYAWLDERMAKHYGIDGVEGGEFRRVLLSDTARAQRGGVLTQASILTITSNPTRTSAVNRGNWVLENLLGTPPPPAPDDVPALEDVTAEAKDGEQLSLRQQLELHREDPSCASCHARMDPIGFALENFNAIGAWRDRENGQPIDASGELYTGEVFEGPVELRQLLVSEKHEAFVRCLAEAMLTYALGRGLEYYDKPALNAILAATEAGDYRFQALIQGVVDSVPFQLRRGDMAGLELGLESGGRDES